MQLGWIEGEESRSSVEKTAAKRLTQNVPCLNLSTMGPSKPDPPSLLAAKGVFDFDSFLVHSMPKNAFADHAKTLRNLAYTLV